MDNLSDGRFVSSAQLAPQLRAVVALADHDGHMTAAADDLGIPQSSMSRRISALQSMLGVPLLIHQGRTVRLTPQARRLATRCRASLDELDRAVAEIVGEADSDRGTVRFGFPLTMGSGRIPDLLAEFRTRNPGIRVVLKQAHGAELEADLLRGDLDLAVVIPEPSRLNHRPIATQPICAVVPTGHHLAHRDSVPIGMLDGEIFIANPANYNLRQATEKWCREAGFIPDVALEVTEFATIRELVSRRLGIALLPHDERSVPGVTEVPLAGRGHTRTVSLAWSTTTHSAPTRKLDDFLVSHWDR